MGVFCPCLTFMPDWGFGPQQLERSTARKWKRGRKNVTSRVRLKFNSQDCLALTRWLLGGRCDFKSQTQVRLPGLPSIDKVAVRVGGVTSRVRLKFNSQDCLALTRWLLGWEELIFIEILFPSLQGCHET